ncbi:MAG: TIGR03808 family TAT-translocated repetitive protein [Alphaproteobacteria bacterium]|nr:TIGR03808 family TAT-translocated repetitive protein [Alphaproteobacteria bacterium]
MTTTRRSFMAGSAGIGAGLAVLASSGAHAKSASRTALVASDFGAKPGRSKPQTGALQKAITAAIKQKRTLFLPGGTYFTNTLSIRGTLHVMGVPGQTQIVAAGGKSLLLVEDTKTVALDGLTFDGNFAAPLGETLGGLVECRGTSALRIERCSFLRSRRSGLSLKGCGGSVTGSTFAENRNAGLFSIDSTGMTITGNLVEKCENNGILIWQSKKRRDGSIVAQNRIRNIGAKDGGSGQNGNGINIYRAAHVTVSDNVISACKFSAVRCNSGDNVQITGNNCSDLHEVALYVEFAFQGAVVSNNIVDTAAIGIAITNLNEGGRLAVCSGNLIRNITRKRFNDGWGVGIGADGDTALTGNVVENAARSGIALGWGQYLQNAVATGNMIKDCPIGVEATTTKGAGRAMISNNIISGAKKGAIFGMHWNKPVTGDLAKPGVPQPDNLTVSGNQAV